MRLNPVLVGVVNRPKDLKIISAEHWYRIPVKRCSKRKVAWLAFYQTAFFGEEGKAIRFYARVLSRKKVRRKDILPDEPDHSRSQEFYYQFRLSPLKSLARPIFNRTRRRVSFAFTTLNRLLSSTELSEVFEVPALEEIMAKELLRRKIPFQREYGICEKRRVRYRLDFAVFCPSGKIVIECDQQAWHSLAKVRTKDKNRDSYLRKRGWTILRFSDQEIINSLSRCGEKVSRQVRRLR